jgi:hypothetical protein
MKIIGADGIFLLLVLLLDRGGLVQVASSALLMPTMPQQQQQQPHPLEDATSWNLHVQRRQLKSSGDDDDGYNESAYGDYSDNSSEDTPYTIEHKKPKKHIPFAGGDTTHGMMIDAGSQGTRLHIFEWEKRFLLDKEDLLAVSQGKKLSIPTSSSRWTDKYTPGIDVFAYHKSPKKVKHALKKYLGPLIDFAKEALKEKKDQWHTYPLFLKATGGMRTLPKKERVRLITAIRELFMTMTISIHLPFRTNRLE